MKKRYKKPQIFMESFEVSEFIAANCNRTGEGVSVTDPNFDENGQYNFGGIMIFLSLIHILKAIITVWS